MKEYLTVKEAIKIYNKSDSTIRRMLRDMTEDDKDKYIVQVGNRHEISSTYLDTVFKPRKAVISENKDTAIALHNTVDKIAALIEGLTYGDRDLKKAIKTINKSGRQFANMTYTMLQMIEQQKTVIDNQKTMIDRLMTVIPGDQLQEEDKPPKPKKSKKSKKGKKSKKKIKSKKGKSKKTKKRI